jgi:hypothetical protein
MMNKLDAVKGDLEKAIAELEDGQSFNIVVSCAKRVDVLGKNALLPAGHEKSLTATQDFLETIAGQGDGVMPRALDAAFNQRPDLIVIISDGDLPNGKALLTRVAGLNRNRRVRVNTVSYHDRDAEDAGIDPEHDIDVAPVDLMRRLAQENDGRYSVGSEAWSSDVK